MASYSRRLGFVRSVHVTLIVLGAATLAACSGDRGAAGSSCTVGPADGGGGTAITCDDGTSVTIPGTGGGSCSVTANGDGSKTIKCADGTTAKVTNGTNGKNGTDGKDGTNGTNGKDGTNGTNGTNGTSADGGVTGSGRSAYVVGPGVVVTIDSVTIPSDLHPVVELTIEDAAHHPLDRTGVYTPDPVSASFVLSYLSSSDTGVGEYVPYNTSTVAGDTLDGGIPPVLDASTEPASESNGTWTEIDSTQGKYSYRFHNALPSDYDQTKTHTLAVYAARTTDGALYASNPLYNFRPDGQDVTQTREIVTTAACNGCHNTLQAHGGSRREVGLCITCHVSGMVDPESGNTIDMAQMIHKIHRGSSLPSVVDGGTYEIVGYRDSIHDFSDVQFPQPIENCDTCHKGPDGARWKTAFSRAACGSCHDNIAFTNSHPAYMKLHSGGQQTTDTLCVNCHGEGMGPVASLETDVTKVHRIPQQFDLRNASDGSFVSAAPVFTGGIVSVTGTGPSDTPVITFDVKVNDQGYDITTTPLDRLRFTFAGPTTDYVNYTQFVVQGGTAAGTLAAVSGTPGRFTWTPDMTITQIAALPTPAIPVTGSWAVGMEARLKQTASDPKNTQIDVTYPMHNSVFYFGVTDTTAVPRRTAVVVENCNNCHQDLQAHGGLRNDPEYCVMCHNANKDSSNIPLPASPDTKLTASLRLSHMIHRIHTGVDGSNEFQIGSHDFSTVRFPGDRRDCTNCHVPKHYTLPLPPLVPSHMTLIDSSGARVNNSDTYMGPTAAACTGCHDDDQTAVHVATQTLIVGGDPSKLKEACATCHGFGEVEGIDIVHARPGL